MTAADHPICLRSCGTSWAVRRRLRLQGGRQLNLLLPTGDAGAGSINWGEQEEQTPEQGEKKKCQGTFSIPADAHF